MFCCRSKTAVATIGMNFIQSCDNLSTRDKCSLLLIKCDICRLVMGQYHSPSGEVISHLNISSVHTRDGGQYSCVATNTVASVRHSARINIYGDQSISQSGIIYKYCMKVNQSLAEKWTLPASPDAMFSLCAPCLAIRWRRWNGGQTIRSLEVPGLLRSPMEISW